MHAAWLLLRRFAVQKRFAGREGPVCASQSGYPYRRCASAPENQCRGAHGGAGGYDVIDEQDVLVRNRRRIRDMERAAHVQPALAGRQAGLAFSGALAHERARGQSQVPCRMTDGKRIQGIAGQGTRLIEAAFGVFGAMKGHRNDKHLRWRLARELSDGLGEHAAQSPRGWVKTVVFEGMDSRFHTAFIQTVRHGADERRRREAASATKGFGVLGGWAIERVSAARAHGA